MQCLPGIIREVCEDLKIPWGHVSSGCIYSGRRPDGKGWTEEDDQIFLFGHHHAVFTVEPKLLVKKFWRVQKIASFGDCEFLSIMSQVQGITYKNCSITKTFWRPKTLFHILRNFVRNVSSVSLKILSLVFII